MPGLRPPPIPANVRAALADIAVGCALGYLDFRFPAIAWRDRHANLARLFKSDSAKIDSLFSGTPVALKRDLGEDEAEKYLVALQRAGAKVNKEADLGASLGSMTGIVAYIVSLIGTGLDKGTIAFMGTLAFSVQHLFEYGASEQAQAAYFTTTASFIL